jgi:hypothetical protein
MLRGLRAAPLGDASRAGEENMLVLLLLITGVEADCLLLRGDIVMADEVLCILSYRIVSYRILSYRGSMY